MTDPTNDEGMTEMMNGFMGRVRVEAERRDETDAVDRVLAAASFVLAAVLLTWPKDRKPWLASLLLKLGQAVWRRKAWWLPE